MSRLKERSRIPLPFSRLIDRVLWGTKTDRKTVSDLRMTETTMIFPPSSPCCSCRPRQLSSPAGEGSLPALCSPLSCRKPSQGKPGPAFHLPATSAVAAASQPPLPPPTLLSSSSLRLWLRQWRWTRRGAVFVCD